MKNGNTTITVAELQAGFIYRIVNGGLYRHGLVDMLEGKIPDPTNPLLMLSDDGQLEVVECDWGGQQLGSNGIPLKKVGVAVPPGDLRGRRFVQVGVCGNAHHSK